MVCIRMLQSFISKAILKYIKNGFFCFYIHLQYLIFECVLNIYDNEFNEIYFFYSAEKNILIE